MKTTTQRFIAISSTSLILASTGLLVGTSSASATPTSTLCDISDGLDSGWEWLTDITIESDTVQPDVNADYSAVTTPIVSLTAGSTYSISLTVEVDSSAGPWYEDVEVWIDFNGNGTLDTGESVFFDTADTGDTTIWVYDVATFSGTFVVPNDAVGGEQWARAMNFDDLNSADVPCWDTDPNTGVLVSGSATDFIVDITPLAPTSYSVGFDANGGTGTMNSQSASSATNLTANSFARTGFTFSGWNTAANGTGTAYANSASYPFTSSTTLYAQWQSIATPAENGSTLANTGNDVNSLAITGVTLIGLGAFALYRRRLLRK